MIIKNLLLLIGISPQYNYLASILQLVSLKTSVALFLVLKHSPAASHTHANTRRQIHKDKYTETNTQIRKLSRSFTEAVGGLVSGVEALFRSDTAPTSVWVETHLEAARRLNAIWKKKTLNQVHDCVDITFTKVLIIPRRSILPDVLCPAPS